LSRLEQPLWKLLGVLFKPHPWHGISPGERVPEIVQCFIEVVPSDTLKYEIDKVSGYLKVDRPQKSRTSARHYIDLFHRLFAVKVSLHLLPRSPVVSWRGTAIRLISVF
jgi:hypothetical protein